METTLLQGLSRKSVASDGIELLQEGKVHAHRRKEDLGVQVLEEEVLQCRGVKSHLLLDQSLGG